MNGMPEESVLDFDCILEMFVKDIDCIQRMQQDEDFVKKCLPDHGNFADMSRCK